MITKSVNIMPNMDASIGNGYAFISVMLGVFTFINWDILEHVMRLLIGVGSIGTAFMAMRHYHLKSKIAKKLLKEGVVKNEEEAKEVVND